MPPKTSQYIVEDGQKHEKIYISHKKAIKQPEKRSIWQLITYSP